MAFDTGAAHNRRSHFGGLLKAAVPAMACAFTLAAATPSHAVDFFLDYASMDTSRTGVIKKNGDTFATVKMAPVLFTAYYGTGNTPATGALSGPIDIVGWCVDIFHSISMGDINLKYNDDYELESDSKYTSYTKWYGETPLTNGQIVQVARLVQYGTLVYDNVAASSDKLNKLSGIQGAIWQVINPTYQVSSGNSGSIKTAVNNYIAKFSGANYNNYITDQGPFGDNIRFISETNLYGTKKAHQSFAFVPEPSTWALLILGFGGAGAMIRRQRKYALAA